LDKEGSLGKSKIAFFIAYCTCLKLELVRRPVLAGKRKERILEELDESGWETAIKEDSILVNKTAVKLINESTIIKEDYLQQSCHPLIRRSRDFRQTINTMLTS